MDNEVIVREASRLEILLTRARDLTTFVQVSLSLLPPVVAFVVAFSTGHKSAWLFFVILAFIAGVIIGAVVVRPYLAVRAMRKQTDVEILDTHIHVEFQGSRRPAEWTTSRKIKALVEGIDSFDINISYAHCTELVTVKPIKGIRSVGSLEHTDTAFWRCRLTLDKSLHKDEVYEFSFKTIVPDNAQDSPSHITISPAHLTKKALLEVEFDSDDLPEDLRRVFWLTPMSKTMYQNTVVNLDARNIGQVIYRRLKPGHRHGMAWKWAKRATAEADSVAPISSITTEEI